MLGKIYEMKIRQTGELLELTSLGIRSFSYELGDELVVYREEVQQSASDVFGVKFFLPEGDETITEDSSVADLIELAATAVNSFYNDDTLPGGTIAFRIQAAGSIGVVGRAPTASRNFFFSPPAGGIGWAAA